MKWNIYVYNPKTQQTVTKVMEYPGTHKSEGAAVTVYAARDLKTKQDYILALPKSDEQHFYGLRIVGSEESGYSPGLYVLQYKDKNGMWFDIGDPKTKARAEAAKKAESHRLVTSKRR